MYCLLMAAKKGLSYGAFEAESKGPGADPEPWKTDGLGKGFLFQGTAHSGGALDQNGSGSPRTSRCIWRARSHFR